MRACRIICRGRYSSMLDMGGMAASPGAGKTKIDRGKNNKLRAVALDFELITKAIVQSKQEAQTKSTLHSNNNSNTQGKNKNLHEKVQPDVSLVQEMANLLNIKMGEDGSAGKGDKHEENGLSNIFNTTIKNKPSSPDKNSLVIDGDIRSKYASKLRSRMDGGLGGVDQANAEKENAKTLGDAAAGHFEARKLAMKKSPTTGKKWIATTGAGNLLSYLSNRSIQIALLPKPNVTEEMGRDDLYSRMIDLTEQLPNIKIDLLVKSESTTKEIITFVMRHFSSADSKSIDALQLLVVSDRDDYLRCARDMGMFTCRLRALNAPRGNITTDYTIQELAEVQEVVNDINGISYHAVFTLNQ